METTPTLSLSILLLSISISISISSAAADTPSPAILLTICSQNKARNAESFDVSFVNTMELIYQNITKHGFGVAASGSDNNTVFGLGQCFGYLPPVPCQLCYAESRVKLPHCLPSTSSRIYLDGCFLRYSDRNFSNEAMDESDATVCGNSTVDGLNSTRFAEMVNGLVMNLTSSAGRNERFYEVGSAEVSPRMDVYGMAQCWRSLNQSGCRDCLENARKSVGQCLPKAEGMVLNTACVVRYSMDKFYLAQSDNSSSSSTARRRLVVVLGCVTVSLVVVVVVIAIFWIRRRASNNSNEDFDGSEEIIRSFSASPLSFKYEELRKATDNFNQIYKLGQGGYGSVYKGILPDGREIAVKRLFFTTRQWVDQFFNEITLINNVQHKNLVKLLGCSVEGPESLLVYEYLCNTSLDHFLFDSFKKNALNWERRFEIIVGTAEGLAYLHTASEMRIIHRDIKASNILLDERFKPKIADFGLARYFAEDQSHLSTGLAGTFGYMAPEYIIHGQLTEKADVYGYGVVVLEIITGQKNHNSAATSAEGHSLTSMVWQHFNSKTLISLLDPFLQGTFSEEEALKIFHVGLLCTQSSPSLRPPMWKVVEMLTGKPKELPVPTQPPFINVKGAEIQSEGSDTSYLLSSSSKNSHSVNQMSVSTVVGR